MTSSYEWTSKERIWSRKDFEGDETFISLINWIFLFTFLKTLLPEEKCKIKHVFILVGPKCACEAGGKLRINLFVNNFNTKWICALHNKFKRDWYGIGSDETCGIAQNNILWIGFSGPCGEYDYVMTMMYL